MFCFSGWKTFLSCAIVETLFIRMSDDGQSEGEQKVSLIRYFRSKIVRLFNEYQPKEDKCIVRLSNEYQLGSKNKALL